MHDEDAALWLLPFMQKTRTPGQVLGSYLKALLPTDRGGSKEYKDFAVTTLPDKVSAASIRKGFVTFQTGLKPDQHIAFGTGHSQDDQGGLPKVTIYKCQDRPLTKDLMSNMGGWPPGEYLKPRDNHGPFPPDLDALEVRPETMSLIIQSTFNLHSRSDVSLDLCSCFEVRHMPLPSMLDG